MAINKVIVNSETVLDLTGTTVTAADLPNGVTAVDNTGTTVTGSTPKIHSAEGTFACPNDATKTLNYRVRDDVVNIYGDVEMGEYTTLIIPNAIIPTHNVWAHVIATDTSGNVSTKKVYVTLSMGGNILRVYNLATGYTAHVNFAYTLGAAS